MGSQPRCRNWMLPMRAFVLRSASEFGGSGAEAAGGVGGVEDVMAEVGREGSRKVASPRSMLKRRISIRRLDQSFCNAPRNSPTTWLNAPGRS